MLNNFLFFLKCIFVPVFQYHFVSGELNICTYIKHMYLYVEIEPPSDENIL